MIYPVMDKIVKYMEILSGCLCTPVAEAGSWNRAGVGPPNPSRPGSLRAGRRTSWADSSQGAVGWQASFSYSVWNRRLRARFPL